MAGKTGLRIGCCGPFARSLGAAGASGGGRDDRPRLPLSRAGAGPDGRYRLVIRLARFGRAAKAGGAAGRSSPLRGTANFAPAIASIVTDRLHLALTWPATLGRQTRLSAAGDAQIDLFR